MASSQSAQRMVHQDFIARVRFSNSLPPPPIPPKLLEMPNTGLASGQYTTPGFASRLAREQPVNIEADAELGMPLDLIGMPGVFHGDESAIQPLPDPPAVHPRDRALLRPLSTLGRPKAGDASVSFLRRTEYISSAAPKRGAGPTPRALLGKVRGPGSGAPAKRPAPRPEPGVARDEEPELARDSPAAIRRRIESSFEVAARLLRDSSRVKHPSRRGLRVVETLPLLPDPESFPDSGAYVTLKFLHAPLPGSSVYDNRLVTGLFRPLDRTATEDAIFKAAADAHRRYPELNQKPQALMNYDFYLGETPADPRHLRAKLDPDNPDRDDDELYTHRGGGSGADGEGDDSEEPHFQFNRVRAYETVAEQELDHASKYDDELVLSIHDHVDEEEQVERSAMYYYPVMQRTAIRPQRTKHIARKVGLDVDENEQLIEQLDVTVADPARNVREVMEWYRDHPREIYRPEEEKAADEDGGGGGLQYAAAEEAAGGEGEELQEEELEEPELEEEEEYVSLRETTPVVSDDMDADGDEDYE